MKPCRVLVVDDEPMVRMVLCDMVCLAGCEVVGEAADGEEAVRQARALQPELILMDIAMPVRDGLSAAAEIRAAQPVPIVFLSAFADSESARRAEEAGASVYVVKPCRQAELSQAIQTALARFGEAQSGGKRG